MRTHTGRLAAYRNGGGGREFDQVHGGDGAVCGVVHVSEQVKAWAQEGRAKFEGYLADGKGREKKQQKKDAPVRPDFHIGWTGECCSGLN
jgi:hypothetical protein